MLDKLRSSFSKKTTERILVQSSSDISAGMASGNRIASELDRAITDLRSGKSFDMKRISKIFDNFIDGVKHIIITLESEKRNAEMEQYRSLQELQNLISSERSVVVSRKLLDIEQRFFMRLSSRLASETYSEMRVSGNKKPSGYFLKGMRSDTAIAQDVARRSIDALKTERQAMLSNLASYIRSYRNKVEWSRIEPQLMSALDSYERNFNDLLVVEVDVEIEEARKLHQIARYSAAASTLKLNHYVATLNALRQRADAFVRQDAVSVKKLRSIAISLREQSEQLKFAETAVLQAFSGISVNDVNMDGVAGTFYEDKTKFNGRGILLMPGIPGSRRHLDLLSKRIAYEGYRCLALDLPSHGDTADSIGPWSAGLNAEFITLGVRTLRQSGCSRVAVAVHSMAAVSAMFAALGYNRKVESMVYSILERYLEFAADFANPNLESAQYERFLSEMNESYQSLKKVILEALKEGRFDQGKIESFVLLSPPPVIKEALPPGLARLIGKVNQRFARGLLNNTLNAFSSFQGRFMKNPVPFHFFKGTKSVQFGHIRIPELKAFMEYIVTFKNPCDYINLLEYFAQTQNSQFISAVLERVARAPPKLFIYGRWDGFLKGYSPGKQKKIGSIYSLMGNHRTIVVPNAAHTLTGRDVFGIIEAIQLKGRRQGITDKQVVREILSFLNATLKGF